MEVYILLICIMIGGSTAFLCNEIACDESPMGELAEIGYKLNKADLQRLCPPTLEFFDCYFKGVKDCLGMEVEEIVKSDDGFAAAIAESLFNARNLAVEMCDEQSTLHKDFLENVECFEGLVNEDSDVFPVCTQKGGLYAEAFLKQFHNIKEEHVDWEELDCLERAYQLACFAEQLENTCGEDARRAFLTIFDKVKFSVNTDCNVETPLSLKRAFFEYLELGGKRSDLYWSVFETYKRR